MRIISTTLQNQTGSAGATGPLGGREAAGPLLFVNTGGQSVTISGGTLRGNSGVPIAFGGPLTIPIGSITVTGTAVNEGVSGDIPAFDIFGSCCGSRNILVRNTAAFSGGVDPKPNSVITQNDINRAFSNLIAAAQSMVPGKLKGQVKANEEVAPNSLICKANATPNHKVGDVAPKVTVTGTATCSEEVFDYKGALSQADAALRMQAASDANLMGYVPVGITAGITNIVKVKGSTTTLQVEVHANGVWEYDFTPTIQQELKLAIAGKLESDALNYVKAQPGVLNATIVLPQWECTARVFYRSMHGDYARHQGCCRAYRHANIDSEQPDANDQSWPSIANAAKWVRWDLNGVVLSKLRRKAVYLGCRFGGMKQLWVNNIRRSMSEMRPAGPRANCSDASHRWASVEVDRLARGGARVNRRADKSAVGAVNRPLLFADVPFPTTFHTLCRFSSPCAFCRIV